MCSARSSFRVALAVFAFCQFSGGPAHAQSQTALSAARAFGNHIGPAELPARCVLNSLSSTAAIRSIIPDDLRRRGSLSTPVLPDADVSGAACLTSSPDAPAEKPCGSGNLDPASCRPTAEPVRNELLALGKSGLKIAQAREEILGILQTENACTAWFELRDPNPAATFRSLSYSIDNRNEGAISESKEPGLPKVFKEPYVASVTQDGGSHSMITINAKGAFYRAQGTVYEFRKEGGPMILDGTRMLKVGSFMGDTLSARMTTLLHEFGHVITLLPPDTDSMDGQSSRNTIEVLHHCGAEVEARAKQTRQTAAR